MNKWLILTSATLLMVAMPGWTSAQESTQPSDTKIIIIEEKIDAHGNKTVKKSVREGNFSDEEIEQIISEESHINKSPKSKGYLGVMIENAEAGVLVTEVVEESPAAKAGLMAGDKITAVNGTPVTGMEGLVELVSAEQPGSVVQINYIREGTPSTASATLIERAGNVLEADVFEWDEHVREREMHERDHAEHEREMELHKRDMKNHEMEMKAHELEMKKHAEDMERHHAEMKEKIEKERSRDSKPRFGVYLDEVEAGPGVLVTRVSEGSIAESAGVQKGDVITSFNGTAVNSSDDLIKAVKSAPADKKVKVELIRQGKKIKEKVVFSET